MGLIELRPDEPFVFMKVGRHAGEDLQEILDRKKQELERAGRIFWGYGGGTMHPIEKVQPFVRSRIEQGGGQIKLLMTSIVSRHPDTDAVAKEFSRDGLHWEPIPEGVEVRGSRYALVIGEIERGDLDVDFDAYQVGAGPSAGKPAAGYIRGRVDKGCLDPGAALRSGEGGHPIHIDFAAKLVDPYAVLLRG
jgi:hypothetical protein